MLATDGKSGSSSYAIYSLSLVSVAEKEIHKRCVVETLEEDMVKEKRKRERKGARNKIKKRKKVKEEKRLEALL